MNMNETTVADVTRRKAGFTLIEVLLVVAILGILAAVVVGNFGNHGDNARIKATRASIAAIDTQIGVYQLDTGRYPASLENLLTSSGEPNWNGPYLRGGPSSIVDSWGTPFNYRTEGNSYKITSAGKDLQIGTEDDITSM
jgi:general secretion pathway protein G